MTSNQNQPQNNQNVIHLDQITYAQLATYSPPIIIKAFRTRFPKIEIGENIEADKVTRTHFLKLYTKQSILFIEDFDIFTCIKHTCELLAKLYPNQPVAFINIDGVLLHNLGHAIKNFINEKEPPICPDTIQSLRTNL